MSMFETVIDQNPGNSTNNTRSAQNFNEIERFRNGRFLSDSEVAWKGLQLPCHFQSVPVVTLELYLEDNHRIVFNPSRGNREQVNRIASRSTLKAFYRLNQVDSLAKDILYLDIPKYFRFSKKDGEYQYQRRKRGVRDPDHGNLFKFKIVGRLPNVAPDSPLTTELYSMKLLLLQRAGVTSEKALRTIGEMEFESCHAAAVHLGLMSDPRELSRVMTEAVRILAPKEARYLFTMLLLRCSPVYPSLFWEEFRDFICQDFIHDARKQNRHISLSTAYTLCLRAIGLLLLENGFSLSDMKLPEVEMTDVLATSIILSPVLDEQQIAAGIQTLNLKQKLVFDRVFASVENHEGGFFFLDAPGGTGKTYTLNLLLNKVALCGFAASSCASSGVASILLVGGRTLHSTFKIPIPITEDSVCRIRKQSRLGDQVRSLDLVVWDEAPMFSKDVLNALDRTFRDIRNEPKKLFGGCSFLLAGDWRQVLPVVPNGGKAQILHEILKVSPLWSQVITMKLTENVRIDGSDPICQEYKNFLLSLGEGKLNDHLDEVEMPSYIDCVHASRSEFCDLVFPNLAENYLNVEWLANHMLLCANNDEVDHYNNIMLAKFPGDEICLLSATVPLPDSETGQIVSPEVINRFNFPNLPPHSLKLKVGVPVMLLRNFDPKRGHCNGTRYTLTKINSRFIEAVVSNGDHKGEVAIFPRITLSHNNDDSVFKFKRTQFPFKLAFASTANKAQGQTIENVGISVKDADFFVHGQLYVSMSRVKHPNRVKILVNDIESGQNSYRKVKNIVYREALS